MARPPAAQSNRHARVIRVGLLASRKCLGSRGLSTCQSKVRLNKGIETAGRDFRRPYLPVARIRAVAAPCSAVLRTRVLVITPRRLKADSHEETGNRKRNDYKRRGSGGRRRKEKRKKTKKKKKKRNFSSTNPPLLLHRYRSSELYGNTT